MSSTTLPRVLIKWCGRKISYTDGLALQQKYLSAHRTATNSLAIPKNVLLLLEHSPVYTVGIRSKNYSSDDETRLRALGADFHRTDRGGLITFHGPGQLVAYPILNLPDFKATTGGPGGGPRGVRWYVCQLERCLIRLCSKYGLAAEAPGPPLTGVWVNGRKIAAIGIHATRTIVSHGLALNCNTDLRWFQHIVPCGLEGKEVTSLLRELGPANGGGTSVNEVIGTFLQAFVEQFQCETVSDADDDDIIGMRKMPA